MLNKIVGEIGTLAKEQVRHNTRHPMQQDPLFDKVQDNQA